MREFQKNHSAMKGARYENGREKSLSVLNSLTRRGIHMKDFELKLIAELMKNSRRNDIERALR